MPSMCKIVTTPLLLLSIGMAGCAHRAPFALAPSTVPVVEVYETSQEVRAKVCQPVLFGVIPLSGDYGMAEVVARATSNHDAVVNVTIDQIDIWWLLGSTRCHELQGIAVMFGQQTPPLSRPAHVEETPETPRQTESRQFGAAAFRITEMIYKAIGRSPPTDENVRLRDAETVWRFALQGHDASALLDAARLGVEEVGKEADLKTILEAGLAK